jgi:hypothetical protein
MLLCILCIISVAGIPCCISKEVCNGIKIPSGRVEAKVVTSFITIIICYNNSKVGSLIHAKHHIQHARYSQVLIVPKPCYPFPTHPLLLPYYRGKEIKRTIANYFHPTPFLVLGVIS